LKCSLIMNNKKNSYTGWFPILLGPWQELPWIMYELVLGLWTHTHLHLDQQTAPCFVSGSWEQHQVQCLLIKVQTQLL
jgi:hypothetical protein